ncbi:SH3 domain-containing protein [Phaeovulum sp. W22_SRMD_FR3]|uniref:SH3 domain-containing protein n=1 Tax=Phaeovulum sp. W22_SRMD_FR3 TaxID=3240274 RepID=UPI003F955211
MCRTLLFVLVTALLGPLFGTMPATAGSLGRYEVFGVEGEDMLKMRAGPGIGYIVILGLPNGTPLRVHDCQSTGGTRWCSVSLEKARGVKGFVSFAYLRKR